MGNIVLWMSISVDGFFEGPNREIDWNKVDDEVHHHFNEELFTDAAATELRLVETRPFGNGVLLRYQRA